VSAGNTLTVKGSDIAAGGDVALTGVNGVQVVSATEAASASSAFKSKKKSSTTSETSLTNRLSTVSAGGSLGVGSTQGAVTVVGADLSATGTTTLVGQSVTVTGVIDSATTQATSRTVKKGLASKKVTTTANSSSTQAVVASTVSGDRVNVIATGGDPSTGSGGAINVRGSNVVSGSPSDGAAGGTGGTVLQATGAISIGTLEARSSESQSVKVKKSGISISGAGFFAGVAKNSNASTLETLTNTGSLVGSAGGNVTVNAGKALTITGSQVAAPGVVSLSGESVTIQNATDTANSTSLSKSSSFGVSIKAYENVSAAVKSVATLADRVGAGAKGGAAATGITAASETLRSVAAVTNALTNTAGITASVGFSKSKSTTASQEQAVVGSSIAGGTVNIVARDVLVRSAENGSAGDVRVTGSSITSAGDTNIAAARDVILESAQNTLNSQFKSKSSGASLGVSVGVAVVGGVTASASVGVSASKSSGTSTETTQANSQVTAGGTLSLTTGRDAILKGAVAQGKDVVATIGRDLSVESVQDTSSRKSTSAGFSAGLTLAPGAGLGGNGGVSVGKGSGSSSIVSEQTALIAREGRGSADQPGAGRAPSLNATVKGNTDIKGGVIAALDKDGKDSGRLALSTSTLTASDIKDSAKSKDISVGVSVSVNNVTDKNKRSANLPTVDGSFASSTFKQDTKATIGQGTLTVGVPTESVTINRDVDAAQVVTKDKQTGFTVYADVAAIREVVAVAKGDTKNSVILQGVAEIKKDFDGDDTTRSQLVTGITNEIKSFGDNKPESGALERLLTQTDRLLRGRQAVAQSQALTIANDPRFVDKNAEEIGSLRGADAVAQVRVQYGDAAANAYAASLETPQGKAQLLAVGQLTLAYRDNGGNLQAIKDGIIPANLRAGGNGTSGAAQPEDVTVNGQAPTFGDKTVVVLAGAGKLINSIPPAAQEAASFGTSILLGGPVAAVGGFFIGKAIEKGIENSPEAQKNIGAVVKEVGLRGVSALSSASLERNRNEAETAATDGRTDAYAESQNLLVAAGTLLSISQVKKLVDKAGGVLKSGINPNGGSVDVPDATPANPKLVPSAADGGFILEAPQIKVPFGTGIANQGFAFEDALEATLGKANRLPPGSKAFDYFDQASGLATSVKTLDLSSPASIANPNSVFTSLKRNVDAIIQYEPRPGSTGSRDISTASIKSAELIVAVPNGATAAQTAAIARAVDYAKLNGIAVKIVVTGGK
jgi:filamentous hemagglutinin